MAVFSTNPGRSETPVLTERHAREPRVARTQTKEEGSAGFVMIVATVAFFAVAFGFDPVAGAGMNLADVLELVLSVAHARLPLLRADPAGEVLT